MNSAAFLLYKFNTNTTKSLHIVLINLDNVSNKLFKSLLETIKLFMHK